MDARDGSRILRLAREIGRLSALPEMPPGDRDALVETAVDFSAWVKSGGAAQPGSTDRPVRIYSVRGTRLIYANGSPQACRFFGEMTRYVLEGRLDDDEGAGP